MSNHTRLDANDRLLSPAQVADRLSLTDRTVYNWMRSGKLPSIKLGHKVVRIRQSSLDQLLAEGSRSSS